LEKMVSRVANMSSAADGMGAGRLESHIRRNGQQARQLQFQS
jgi:hypothetical protein